MNTKPLRPDIQQTEKHRKKEKNNGTKNEKKYWKNDNEETGTLQATKAMYGKKGHVNIGLYFTNQFRKVLYNS